MVTLSFPKTICVILQRKWASKLKHASHCCIWHQTTFRQYFFQLLFFSFLKLFFLIYFEYEKLSSKGLKQCTRLCIKNTASVNSSWLQHVVRLKTSAECELSFTKDVFLLISSPNGTNYCINLSSWLKTQGKCTHKQCAALIPMKPSPK